MTGYQSSEGPSEAELRKIELEHELIVAELALVDAEASLAERLSRFAVAAYLEALLEVVDLLDLPAYGQPSSGTGRGMSETAA